MPEEKDPLRITFGSEKHHMEELLCPRPLSGWEETIIDRIVGCATGERNALHSQLRTASVVGECRHCPTVWLKVDAASSQPLRSARGELRFGIASCESEGRDLDGMPISILLHLNGGLVSELEVFRGDSEPLLAMPRPEPLNIVRPDDVS